MGWNDHIEERGPDLDEIIEELSEWIDQPSDWIGPPKNFRARGFVEDIIYKYEEWGYSTDNFTPAQEDAIKRIYYSFGVYSQVEILRDYQRAADKD